jgi:prepilin-type N-terminal cleavage/methylation domain-containing protein/prepilin-type processing-associated H-X9-DG protein
MKSKTMSRGFTLIELLVVITIMTILSCLTFYGYSNVIKSGQKAAEVSAARTLIAGFHTYAIDNNGRVLAGMEKNTKGIVDDKGKPVMSQAAKRYAWRIAPYIDFNVDSVLLVNNTKAAPKEDPMYSYLVTVYTTLGMNTIYVGGKYGTPQGPDNPKNTNIDCVTNIMQAHNPSKLIVFASAYMGDDAPHAGAFEVSLDGNGTVGKVDFKYGNKAVVAHFDGHVELLGREELSDMRRWSNLAAIQDKSD